MGSGIDLNYAPGTRRTYGIPESVPLIERIERQNLRIDFASIFIEKTSMVRMFDNDQVLGDVDDVARNTDPVISQVLGRGLDDRGHIRVAGRDNLRGNQCRMRRGVIGGLCNIAALYNRILHDKWNKLAAVCYISYGHSSIDAVWANHTHEHRTAKLRCRRQLRAFNEKGIFGYREDVYLGSFRIHGGQGHRGDRQGGAAPQQLLCFSNFLSNLS